MFNSDAPPSVGMHLQELYIRNFRSCYDVQVRLQPDITLLVGENNAGKSSIIDSLRLATVPLSRRRTRYFEPSDFSTGADGPIDLTCKYSGLTPIQAGRCGAALDLSTREAWYTTRYPVQDDSRRRNRWELLSGSSKTPDIEPEVRDRLTHVYLEPLRDAQRELDSATGSRLAAAIRALADDSSIRDFVKQANQSFHGLAEHKLLRQLNQSLQKHVEDVTAPLSPQTVGVGFQDYSLHRLAQGLRVKMAAAGMELNDIANSGLGYANLLFMATVIMELRNAQDAELTLFLVEEPEAHLHPQLQSVLLGYLQDQAIQSPQDDRGGPAGRIQVVATTHSPNLTSSVGTNRIVVIRRTLKELATVGGEQIQAGQTQSIALSSIPLTHPERRKVDQYLDATRAELLFSRRPILVEGIAEAVLLPILAQRGLSMHATVPATKLKQQLRGLTTIAIGSVDFAPYIKLLLTPVQNLRLADHVIVITDGDPPISELNHDPDQVDSQVHHHREEQLQKLAESIGSPDALTVKSSRYTLEADLLIPFEHNSPAMQAAFLLQKPRSIKTWNTICQAPSPAQALYELLQSTPGLISKGAFASDLAQLIPSHPAFQCPPYLRHAVEVALGEHHVVG